MTAALQSAHAGVTTEERFTYYEVTGNTALELRASINRERLALGKRYDALTSWNIRWQFSFTPRQTKCEITDVTIDATIEYLMPAWNAAAQHANAMLVKEWRRYLHQLTAHERHHGRLVKIALADIERAIYQSDDTASSPSTCSGLEALANRNASQVVSRMEALQIEFDRNTDHGRVKGATFP
jgi:predicted secreted Zn-dependent protease